MTGDWVRAIEAAYAPARNDDAWGKHVLDAAEPLFPNAQLGFHAITHSADCRTIHCEFATGTFSAEQIEPMVSGIGVDGLRVFYYPDTPVRTAAENLRSLDARVSAYWKGILEGSRIADALGLITEPAPGAPMVFWAGFDKTQTVTREHRARLTQLALHLETAYRLRRSPEVVRAVVRTDGKVLHHEEGAPSPALLERQAANIERARSNRRRRGADAMDLWTTLVAGKVSFVERTEGSRRHYLVVENAPARQSFRAFTPSELDIVGYAARGLTTKEIAYALGVSAATVSVRLAHAATKVGLASRMELVRLAAIFTHDPRARFDDGELTAAERDVLELLRQGLSNRAIAERRSRSVRTIANQVARLLQKLKAPSRRALVTRV